MFGLIKSFEDAIKNDPPFSWERQCLVMGLSYMEILFGTFYRGSEGLKLDLHSTKRNFTRG